MNRLSGYVLVRESNQGIPNLVVAAFDAEDIPAPAREKRSRAQLLREVGRPIASVLTGAEGRFELSISHLEFQGNETRPNLVVIVFAPEDVLDPALPCPKAPADRMLYISFVARRDAGAEEAYVIRLLQAQLDRHEIPTSTGASNPRSDAIRHSRALADATETRDALRERQKPFNKDEYGKQKRYAEIASRKMGRLSAIPPQLRAAQEDDAALLIEHRENLAEKLPVLQRRANKEGLADLRRQKPSMKLRLGEADLRDLGLKHVDGRLSGEIPMTRLASKVRELMGGVELIRIRGAESPPIEELDRKYPAPEKA